jgi:hypothetical protein
MNSRKDEAMPDKATDMQKRFAVEYASNGGNATQAAKDAGYSTKSAHELGRQLLEKAHVHEMVLKELNRLRYRSGVTGLNALMQIAQDQKAPANARVSAARVLCEHSGLLGSARDDNQDFDDERYEGGVTASEVLRYFEEKGIGGQA